MTTRIPSRAAALMLSALAVLVASIVQPIAADAASDPFRLASRPDTAQSITYVGRDTKATSIAIVLAGDGTAVGYACDGTGRISAWFTGTYQADTGTVTLTGAGGAQLNYNLGTTSGSLVIGSTTTFRLAPATGSAGLFRKAVAIDGVPAVTGWIVGNDALVVGTGSVAGKPVVSLAEKAGATGSDPIAETISTGSTGSDPVPTGLLKNLRCGRLQVKIDATTTGAQAIPILERITDLGCNTALLGSAT